MQNNCLFFLLLIYLIPLFVVFTSLLAVLPPYMNLICQFHSLIICDNFNLPDIFRSNNNYDLTYFSVNPLRILCIPELYAHNSFFQFNSLKTPKQISQPNIQLNSEYIYRSLSRSCCSFRPFIRRIRYHSNCPSSFFTTL